MSPFVFVAESGLLILCFFIHIALWRWRRPRNQAAALCAIFFLPVAAAFLGLVKMELSSEDIFSVLLLHLSLSSAYILTYPALEGLSPSLGCLLLIGRERGGLTAAELLARFDETVLQDQKIGDLLESGLVAESEGKLHITARGKLFIRPFVLLRSLLGLPMGQG